MRTRCRLRRSIFLSRSLRRKTATGLRASVPSLSSKHQDVLGKGNIFGWTFLVGDRETKRWLRKTRHVEQ